MEGPKAGGATPAADAKDLLILYGHDGVNARDDSSIGRGSWN